MYLKTVRGLKYFQRFKILYNTVAKTYVSTMIELYNCMLVRYNIKIFSS